MAMLEQIEKKKQMIARSENSLALEKLKQLKADTRRKIELGGLVIKSGLAEYKKELILGALKYAFTLIAQDSHYKSIFETIGETEFYPEKYG